MYFLFDYLWRCSTDKARKSVKWPVDDQEHKELLERSQARSREMECCSTRALGPVGIPDIRVSCRVEVLLAGTSLIQRYSLLLQLHAVPPENPGNAVIVTVLGLCTVSWSTLIYKTFDFHLLEGVPFTFLVLYYLLTKLLVSGLF